jgi:hypothetical protein
LGLPLKLPLKLIEQTADSVLLIRPRRFGWNPLAATSNSHQVAPTDGADTLQARAEKEFDGLVARLTEQAISVEIFTDELEPHTPDSIFPNNWFSTHDDGTLVLYPMAVPNRRAERRPAIVDALKRRLRIKRVVDLTPWESRGKYLEGTGSLVLDRVHRIAYAARSVRTHDEVVSEFAAALGYRPILFHTQVRRGNPEYHTNVVMSVGERAAVCCLSAIAEPVQRAAVWEALTKSGHHVIEVTLEQMDAFAGNLLQLRNAHGTRFWVMSERAFSSLRSDQRARLEETGQLLFSPLHTIEAVGGGSARCMLAELFAERSCAGAT